MGEITGQKSLAQRQKRLAVSVLIESHRGAEMLGVAGIGRAIAHHDPLVRHELQKVHEVREALHGLEADCTVKAETSPSGTIPSLSNASL